MIQGIELLLRRFERIGLPDETVRKAAQKALLEVCGVECDISLITVRKGVALVSLGSIERNEVFMKKRSIMKVFERELGASAPSDIR